MAFKQTAWEFSDVREEAQEFRLPEPGETFLKIEDADYDRDKHRYMIQFESIDEGLTFRIYYNVDRLSSRTGEFEPNISVRNCLVGLNRAIFNAPKGMPNPEDIKGAVVMGEIQIREYDGQDVTGNPVKKKAASIWRYEAVPEDIVLSYGDIEQYYIGYEEDEDGSDDEE